MALKKGQIFEIEIETIAFGGRGLGRLEGMAVFVDQALPGDRVRARVVRKKKRHAEARMVELLEPSADRVDPPCPYVGWCGGCKWQALKYERQLVYKRDQVEEALGHIAGIDRVSVHPTLASQQVYHYRNKMEFSCADRRWLLPAQMGDSTIDTGFALGLHVPGTFYKVLDIEACLLQPDLGNQLLDTVRRHMRASGRPPYGLKSHVGFWRFLMLRHAVAHDHWMVNLVTSEEDRETVQPLADDLVMHYPQVVSVVNNISDRRAAIAVGEREILLAGEPVLRESVAGLQFNVSANSFFQTNTLGAAALYGVVERMADLQGTEQVLDLYSGTGAISIYLAARARSVVGFEWTAAAVADAEINCRLNGLTNCRFVEGDVLKQLPAWERPVDVMIIDPPRVGMHPKVLKQVIDLAPGRIVYVSCNPATLARDLLALKTCYQVAEVQPVDLFPHTWHIEAVARLEKINP